MGLPLFITISLSIFNIFLFQKKQLTFIQNSIVFMMMTIVTTNYITIVSLNLKWIKTTQDPFLFIGVLLYRDIIIPILVLIFINAIINSTSIKNKGFYFISTLIALQVTEFLCLFVGLIEYVKWNFFYTALLHSAFLFIGFYLSKMVIYVQQKELGV